MVPAEVQVAVGAVELGQVRQRRRCGRRRAASRRPSRTPASPSGRGRRFHDGSCCAVTYRSRLRSAVALEADGGRRRVVVRGPHARSTDGGRADRPPRAPGGPPRRRTVRAYSHCSGKSCQQQHAELVGGVVQLGAGDVAVHAQEVEPGLEGELEVARAPRPAWRRRGRRRVGSRLAPLRNSRSPLTEHTQSCQATSRSPVRRFAGRSARRRRAPRRDTSVSCWSPSDHGHHSARVVDVEVPARSR